jgi:xanthine dehydrogenase YagR molybdenum-binding subunit
MSFGAIFVEVRVDPDLGEVRVSRAVGVYDVGHILNPMLARSQLIGGINFGIGMALMEATVPDLNTGSVLNANLADYHVPVSRDRGDAIPYTLLSALQPFWARTHD